MQSVVVGAECNTARTTTCYDALSCLNFYPVLLVVFIESSEWERILQGCRMQNLSMHNILFTAQRGVVTEVFHHQGRQKHQHFQVQCRYAISTQRRREKLNEWEWERRALDGGGEADKVEANNWWSTRKTRRQSGIGCLVSWKETAYNYQTMRTKTAKSEYSALQNVGGCEMEVLVPRR